MCFKFKAYIITKAIGKIRLITMVNDPKAPPMVPRKARLANIGKNSLTV
jgi:hypothetical protein